MPRFSNTMLRRLASDWQIAPIMYFRSAQYFTVTSGVDNALTGAPGQTPNYNGANPYATSPAMYAGALRPVAYQRRWLGIYHPRPGDVRQSRLQQHKRAGRSAGQHGHFANLRASGEDDAPVPRGSVQHSESSEFLHSERHLACKSREFRALMPRTSARSRPISAATAAWRGGDPRILQAAMKFVF